MHGDIRKVLKGKKWEKNTVSDDFFKWIWSRVIRGFEKKRFWGWFFSEGSKINNKELTLFQRLIRGINKNSLYIKKIEKEIYIKFISKLERSYDYIFDFWGKAKVEAFKDS